MRILFTQAVAQLYQVVETPYPVYFDQALNCVRLLSRLSPFLLEKCSPTILVTSDKMIEEVSLRYVLLYFDIVILLLHCYINI